MFISADILKDDFFLKIKIISSYLFKFYLKELKGIGKYVQLYKWRNALLNMQQFNYVAMNAVLKLRIKETKFKQRI